MEVKRDILWRVYLCFLGIVFLGVMVLGRVFYIQRFQGAYWKSKSDSLHTKILNVEAERGTIFSDDGSMLSTSVPYFDVYIDFMADGLREKDGKRFRDNVDSLSIALAGLFKDHSATEYRKALQGGYKSHDRYFQLRKGLTFDEYKAMRDFPLVRQGRNKSGFIADIKSRRLNPFGLLANRTIGLARENAQNIGLERTYDTLLKGESGKKLVRFIAGGVAVPIEGYEIEAENGHDIITTIDVNTQDIAENALLKMMFENEAEHGTAVVMEVATGKIRAMANLGLRKDGNYWEDYNYALRATEPGSTIKLATLLSVLSEGKTTINDLVSVGSTGTEWVGVRPVNDAERAPKPVMTVRECFAHSSNVGMSKIAWNSFSTQPERFLNYLHQYHFDRKTGIDLVGEERPVLPKIKRNKEGMHAMVTMSFGYAIEVTPLQTLMLYNAIANEGKMMKPYLVSRVQQNGIVSKEYEPEVVEEKIADAKVIKDVQNCMLAVTTEGTGKKPLANTFYRAAGKTGTAHVAGAGLGYDDGVYQASFVGYFPYDKPKYSCIVVIKTKAHPAKHMGGEVSAPVFREIADRLNLLNTDPAAGVRAAAMPKTDSGAFYYTGLTHDIRQVMSGMNMKFADSTNNSIISSLYNGNDNTMVLNNHPTRDKTVPDVKGMGLKDALYVLENLKLRVISSGKGKVTSQSLAPGTALNKNLTINLALN